MVCGVYNVHIHTYMYTVQFSTLRVRRFSSRYLYQCIYTLAENMEYISLSECIFFCILNMVVFLFLSSICTLINVCGLDIHLPLYSLQQKKTSSLYENLQDNRAVVILYKIRMLHYYHFHTQRFAYFYKNFALKLDSKALLNGEVFL